MGSPCIGLHPEAIDAHHQTLIEFKNRTTNIEQELTIDFCLEIFKTVRDQGLITIQDASYDQWR